MRRSTRSSSGRPMSPDAEQLQEHQEKHTRSRKPSGQPVHPDIELFQGSEERATRSRKPSEDLVVLELPRITRTGRRSGSGKSPDPPKSSARGGKSGESGQRHDKRGLSPAEEPAGETSTKRRRRSGRLAEGDGEKDKQEVQENDEEDASDIKEKAPEKKGKSPRLKKQDVNLKEKGAKDGDSKEKEDKDVKAKKDKNKDPKEQKNVEDSTASSKEPSGTSSRRRTRSGRQGTDGDEESNTLSLPQVLQDSKPDHPKKATEDIHTEEPASKHQKSKDHGRSSSKIGQDKEKRDTSKLRSPPRSPEKSKKVETAKVELPKISLDLGELTVKTSSKPSPRGALSPPLRMSPRRARQPSGQKSCDDSESTESKNTQDKISSEEIAPSTSPGHQAQGQPDVPEKDKIKDKPDKTKKSASACRDISKEFDDSKEKTHSPKKSSRSKKEEDILSQKEEYMCNDQEKSSPSKSHKKSRNHTKSPRESPASSPRKGLRSGKAPEADGTLDPNMAQELDQVNVVTMEISSVPPPLTTDACTSQEIRTEKENDSQEVNHAPIASQLLATEKQTKESDNVKEISDEVAAKIREWRVQEEESVGFQGEEWYAEEVDEGEPFYYESDHMALKGNKDYRMLLRTITTLEAQRKQAVKDLDKLVTAQREALRNPLKFVHKLQKKDSLHLPSPQRIVLLPEIPWGRYLGHADSKELIQGLSQTQTRASLKQKDSTEDSGAGPSSSSGPKEDQTLEDDEKMKSVIRGRLWDESKPDTFNRLWTVGEQKRLEDLLLKYPSEEVEARRWEKIAKDLGNRTRHQVASRVQKYFIKLGKAGLPIPGRMPNMATYTNKKPSQRRFINPYNRLTLAPSTFLQSLRAPVLMNEDDALDYDLDYDADSIMEEDDIPSELKDSEEYKELVRLKKLRNATLKQTDMSHVGYSCDGCGVSPIVGVRWHCVNCPMDISTDLCQNCVNDDFQSDIHSSSHRMDPVHIGQSGGFVDSDYTSFTGTSGDYNYLDPNYSPAVL
ncbi:ZZ-type zinc finger-containing protein 3-like isoform X2 [Lytechinus variegatus]|uniref:ZZ-type zinc finger-containing protein 3-like isoform X2 n=1 Tax=Lytechinus variegatus TaxID=7654 RepID=UPI001BB1CCF4|nr:ZZ-type zinc finger-containing protein 3-like isoform X2 [Lytechinus variegatus]